MAKTKITTIRKAASGETKEASPASHEDVYTRIGRLYCEAQRLEKPDEYLAMYERERTIYEAMLRGDVLPSPKYDLRLTNRVGAKPFDPVEMERRRIVKELQKSFADACPDYLGAIQAGLDEVNERLEEFGQFHCDQLKEAADMRELARQLEVQAHLFVSIEMVYKYCPKPDVRERLETEMRKAQSAYRDGLKQAQESEDWKTHPYQQLALLVKQTCGAYAVLLKDLRKAENATLDEYRTESDRETYRLLQEIRLGQMESHETLANLADTAGSLKDMACDTAGAMGELSKRIENVEEGVEDIQVKVSKAKEAKRAGGKRGARTTLEKTAFSRKEAKQDVKLAIECINRIVKTERQDPHGKMCWHVEGETFYKMDTIYDYVCKKFGTLVERWNLEKSPGTKRDLRDSHGKKMRPDTLGRKYREHMRKVKR